MFWDDFFFISMFWSDCCCCFLNVHKPNPGYVMVHPIFSLFHGSEVRWRHWSSVESFWHWGMSKDVTGHMYRYKSVLNLEEELQHHYRVGRRRLLMCAYTVLTFWLIVLNFPQGSTCRTKQSPKTCYSSLFYVYGSQEHSREPASHIDPHKMCMISFVLTFQNRLGLFHVPKEQVGPLECQCPWLSVYVTCSIVIWA